MSLRKLLAAVMVVSMVFGLVGTTVFAQAEAAAVEAATGRLQGFGIVTGDPDGGLRLEDSITRAEMMAVLVRANGLEDVSQLLQGTSPFSDVAADAWYAGYIAIGKSKGWTTGYPDGTFKPGNPVTNAEVLAFLARVAGLAPAAAAWPENYIKAATDAGLVPADLDLAALANQPSVRGVVFTLADAFFMKVRDANGKNMYQRYHDSDAPVVSLDALAPQTSAASVKASGKVEGAEAAFVNGNPLVLAADGSFSADIELAVGANDIVITAVDLVGNEGSAKAKVERINTAAAHIAVPASVSVAAGAGSALSVIVHDTNGAEIAGAPVTAKVEPEGLGTFDAATGTFTAGTKAGTGTLTLMSGEVSATVAVTVTPAALAKIEVTPGNVAIAKGDILTFGVTGLDAFGNAITGLTPSWVVTNADGSPTSKAFISSTGAFIGSDFGSYKVTATVDAFTASATAGIYGAATAVKITSGPATLVANGESMAKFEVMVVDANGNLAGAFGSGEDEVLTLDMPNELTRVNSKGAAAPGTTLTIDKGVGTFYVTAAPGTEGIVADITVSGADLGPEDPDNPGMPLDLEAAAAELELLEQVATGLKVDADVTSKYLTANESDSEATAGFLVVDQDGVAMQDGQIYDVDLTVSGPAIFPNLKTTTSTTYDGAGDAAEVTVLSDKGKTGTVTVTATSEGLGSATATLTAAIAGAPKLIKVTSNVESITADDLLPTGSSDKSTAATFSVEVTDAAGIPTPISGHLSVSVSAVNSADGKTHATWATDLTDTFGDTKLDLAFDNSSKESFQVTSQKIGTVTVTLDDQDDVGEGEVLGNDPDGIRARLDKASGSVAVTPDVPDNVAIKSDAPSTNTWTPINGAMPTYVVPASAPKATAMVAVKDQFGNVSPASGVLVTLEVTEGNAEDLTINGKRGDSETLVVRTGEGGTAEVNVVGREYAGETYEISIVGAKFNTDSDADLEILNIEDPTTFAVHIAATVAASVSVQTYTYTELYEEKTANSVTAGDRVYIVVTVKDAYGRKITDDADFLKVTGVDGVFEPGLATPDFADTSNNPPADNSGVVKSSDLTLTLQDDDSLPFYQSYVAEVYAVKSGRPSISVTDSAATTPVSGSRSLNVVAQRTLADLTVTVDETIENADEEMVVPATLGKAAPYTLRLSDKYGNPVNLNTNVEVSWSVTAGDAADLSFRSAPDGQELASTTLKSTKRIYVVAKDNGGDYPQQYTVSFTVDIDLDEDVDAHDGGDSVLEVSE